MPARLGCTGSATRKSEASITGRRAYSRASLCNSAGESFSPIRPTAPVDPFAL